MMSDTGDVRGIACNTVEYNMIFVHLEFTPSPTSRHYTHSRTMLLGLAEAISGIWSRKLVYSRIKNSTPCIVYTFSN